MDRFRGPVRRRQLRSFAHVFGRIFPDSQGSGGHCGPMTSTIGEPAPCDYGILRSAHPEHRGIKILVSRQIFARLSPAFFGRGFPTKPQNFMQLSWFHACHTWSARCCNPPASLKGSVLSDRKELFPGRNFSPASERWKCNFLSVQVSPAPSIELVRILCTVSAFVVAPNRGQE